MKELGQVFTPTYIVKKILDEINYNDSNIIDKKILEPSFGEGIFLMEIIERIINYCESQNFSKDFTKQQIENNVYGIEIDEVLYNNTIENIIKLLNKHNLYDVNLHLYNENTLDYNFNIKFDFIVGNPPYVRIHNLKKTEREKLKKFKFSKGTTDLYVIFFELCINILNENGILGFITPNSYLKNTSQKTFRNYLIDNNLITKMINYGSNKVFENADTYAMITILNKNNNINIVKYIYNDTKKDIYLIDVDMNNYKDKEWSFGNKKENDLIKQIKLKDNQVSTSYNIQYGLATNADKVYINEITELDSKCCIFNGYKIEKDILIDIVKGSKYNGISNKKLLFPYVLKDNKYCIMEEEFLKTNYPFAYDYLLANKEQLESRDLENNCKWYQFARSQAINTIQEEKLLIKHIISSDDKKVQLYKIPKNTAIYSGLYATSKSDSLDKLKEILETEEFCEYCKIVGKDMSGGYKSISSKNVKNYNY